MTMGITLDIIGQRKVSRSMDALIQHMGKDLRPMLRAVRDWWYTWQSEVFASEGGTIRSWAALSPEYKEWKDEHYPGRPILELTGQLHGAMTGSKKDGGWQKIKPRWMTLGTSGIPYTLAHNFGVASRKLPARPFLRTTREAEVALDKAMQSELARVKRAILRELGGPGGMAR